MSDEQLPPRDAGARGRVVACFLCATFAPLPPRWKQGRLQLDIDGVRFGPGFRGREGGSLLPRPLTIDAVREVRGWERIQIKGGAYQVIEVGTDQGGIRMAVPRERVGEVVDHIHATGPQS
jgi:hypothetical protein